MSRSGATPEITLMRRAATDSGLGYSDNLSQQSLNFSRFSSTSQQHASNTNGIISSSNSAFTQIQPNQGLGSSQIASGSIASQITATMPIPNQLDYTSLEDEFPSLSRPNIPQTKRDISSDLSNGLVMNNSTSGQQGNDLGMQVLTGFGGMIRSYLPPENASSFPSGFGSGQPTSNATTGLSALNSTSTSLNAIGPSAASTNAIGPATSNGAATDASLTQSSPNKQGNSKYGLLGLKDVILMTNQDVNVLALGSDLAGFGLNLNSTDCLYSSFISPFSDQPAIPEPQYSVPLCYIMHPPILKPENVAKFQIESLFYMFYMMPRDAMQAIAAQELYRREWKYHNDLRLWLKLRTQQEILQSHSNVPFVYFDITSWEPKLFTTSYRGNILVGFLSEEDIKSGGKPSNTAPVGMSNQAVGPMGSSSNPSSIGSNIPIGPMGGLQGLQS